MTDKQPEALRLADAIEKRTCTYGDVDAAADELRRLYVVNAELVEVLKDVMRLAKQTSNVAYNLGQSHEQRESILQTVYDLDGKLREAHTAIAKATGEQQ